MALVSMKTDGDSGCCAVSEANPYGYGLRIRLNNDQCEALGIKTPPAAGNKLRIGAVAFVASATQSVEQDGDDAGADVFLELQITDMEVTPAGGGGPDASAMYPNSAMA
jgi:hypothetical protein